MTRSTLRLVTGTIFSSAFLFVFHQVHIAAQQDDNVVLVRIKPSQSSLCSGQMVEYQCRIQTPVNNLAWTLPTGGVLGFSEFDDVGAIRKDGEFTATLTGLMSSDDSNNVYLFNSTIVFSVTLNSSILSCSGIFGTDSVEEGATVTLSGSPNPPFNGSYMYDGGLTVHLQWNRPSYTGGAPVENYTVSANGQSETVSDSNEVVSYTSSGLIYGEVLVITINRCGLESQSALITIPASAPPNITELSVKFSCDASLDQFPVIINWMSEDRSDRVVYPEVNLVNVMLHPQIDSDISEELFCCIVTDTSCATTITDRDVVYTVIVNNTNVIGSTVNISKFNARILFITEEMLSSDAENLSVTVSANELCFSDTFYIMLVTFGSQPLTSSGRDCEGQVNTNIETVSSGDSATFSVPADTVTRRENEEYCYTLRVGDEIVCTASTNGNDEAESSSLSANAVLGILVTLTLLVALPCGVVIGVCVTWWIRRSSRLYERRQQFQRTNAAVYEETVPQATSVMAADIPLSQNQAYGHINMQRRRED